jgi:hypothetical protein
MKKNRAPPQSRKAEAGRENLDAGQATYSEYSLDMIDFIWIINQISRA